MPKKNSKIQIGDLWKLKRVSLVTTIYIVKGIIQHPFRERSQDTIHLAPVDEINHLRYTLTADSLLKSFRKIS